MEEFVIIILLERGGDMPELPEVEVNRIGLKRLVKGKTVKDFEVYWPKIIVNYDESPEELESINTQTILDVSRRGKYLVFVFEEAYLVSHLRMEGKYFYFDALEIPTQLDKHTHVVIQFTDGSQLHYNDVRKFGRIEYVEKNKLTQFFKDRKLGPEPTQEDFHLDSFTSELANSKQSIKTALLSQKMVTGLGNIYVDEVLFASRIHPLTKGNELTQAQIIPLYHAIIDTMSLAIQLGGSTIRSYKNTVGESGRYQNELKVYGKTNQPCVRCMTPIEKIRVAQRGTHFCPKCQSV